MTTRKRRRLTKKQQKIRAEKLVGNVLDELKAASPREKLNKLVKKAYPAGGWKAYRKAIKQHENPAEQIKSFEDALIILQPKQLEFAGWVWRLETTDHIEGEQGSPELGFGGARGPGKSFVGFVVLALYWAQRLPGGSFLYLRKHSVQAEQQLTDLVRAVLGNVPHEKIRGMVRFPNGSVIRIGHYAHESDLDKYLGIEYDGILIEEATRLRPQSIQHLRASLRTSKEGWRPMLLLLTNPLGIGHMAFKKRFIDHERKYATVMNRTRKFIFATVTDNLFINRDYVGILDGYTGAELKAYRFGDWDVSAGAYFDEWSYDRHVEENYRPTPFDTVWCSMDYGYNHWNVFYFHARTPDGIIHTFAEMAHRKYYPSEIAPELIDTAISYGLSDFGKMFAGGDVFNETGQSRETIADQYAALGIKLERAITDPGSRVSGAIHMAALLGNHERGIEPTWFVSKCCERLIDTIPMLERNPNKPEDVLKWDADKDGNGGDDAYDAARYGLYLEKQRGQLSLDIYQGNLQ